MGPYSKASTLTPTPSGSSAGRAPGAGAGSLTQGRPGIGSLGGQSRGPPAAAHTIDLGSRPIAAGGPVNHPKGRTDVQRLGPRTKGNPFVAKAVAEDRARMAAAEERLEQRKYAQSTRGPRDAKAKLVEYLIGRSDPEGGVYPLTMRRVRRAAACLMEGGYRAAAGYLSVAKLEHV